MLEVAISETARQGVFVDCDLGLEPSAFPIAASDEDEDEPDAPEDVPKPSEHVSPPLVATPELTHPGESQSNGLAERTVRTS